ncbi:MAG TPA: glutathione S-transferase family protein [Candidatus Binataceae bacterium]|nr:glutathione S-transferase family protein [Candidatus Binataceae bacterium]
MKIYDSKVAPNPRRVRIFLAEKGVEVPYEQVDIGTAKNRTPEFLKINPMGGVPVLELDDGTHIAESVAICRYFEALHPTPPLMGTDARDQAIVEMWHRRMELNFLGMVAGAFRNTSEFFKGRIPQVPEYGEVCRQAAEKMFGFVDQTLANRQFIAGDRYSIADILALVAVDFAKAVKLRITPEQTNLKRWHDAVSSRPSAKA